jgi:hypothetical protein
MLSPTAMIVGIVRAMFLTSTYVIAQTLELDKDLALLGHVIPRRIKN